MRPLEVLLTLFQMPGVVVHELGHKMFCDIFGVRVHKVRYFSFQSPPGFVVHEQPDGFVKTFLITIGPFILNSLVAMLFAIFSLQYSLWLALVSISIAMQSFPSKGDAKSLWIETKRHMKRNLLAVIGYPISGLIMLMNLPRSFWFDLAYGIAFYLAVVFLL
jgi:hypothetical protein